jgi:hypothetical protein
MEAITFVKNGDTCMIPADEMFQALNRKSEGRDSFRNWMADRITSLEMEEGEDYFLFINVKSAREMSRYETIPEQLKRFLENFEQYI